MDEETLFRAKRDEEGHLCLEIPSTGIIVHMDKIFWQRIVKRWEWGSEFLGGFKKGVNVEQHFALEEVKDAVDNTVKMIKEGLKKWEEKK